ncbi:MAG: hypothetical protein OXG24_03570 [Gammaproteobacteria bacterium]|nr:hypothetical protein [Gammaproteobacteria bacterium]
MERESGSRDSPIWLIGDSAPAKWESQLKVPLDSRHPTRHNIWTPILEGIQSHLFSRIPARLDITGLYIRNAVHQQSQKPVSTRIEWSSLLETEIITLGRMLTTHAPALVLSFGGFAFEFARRSLDKVQERSISYWSAKRLGEEFSEGLRTFNVEEINLVPLLHASIARGKFLTIHDHFTQTEGGNYFESVAREIGDCLLENEMVFRSRGVFEYISM